MKTRRYRRIEVVSESSPLDFQDKLNALFERLEGKKFTEQLYNNENGFTAYITFEEVERIAECLKDEYELKGITPSCGECPFYVSDKGKYGHCDYVRGRIAETDLVDDCKPYWEWLEEKEMGEMYQLLKEAIKEKYKTFTEFSVASGIDRTYLSRMLNGKTSITLENKFKILKALGVARNEKNIVKYFGSEEEE